MNQQDVDRLFYNAVTSGDLTSVKHYLLEATPRANIFYNSNDALMYAAGTNQINLLEFLLTSPELTVHSDDEQLSPCVFTNRVQCNGNHNGLSNSCIRTALNAKEKALVIACQYGCFPAVRYLLTCDRFSTPIDVHYNEEQALGTACRGSQIPIVQYLLTYKELKERADIHGGGERALRWALRSSLPNEDIVEYLLTNSKLKEHANIYDNDCAPFFELVNNPSTFYNKEGVWEYLVFNYKIEIKPPIAEFIQQNPNHIGAKLLAKRELHDGLRRDLKYNPENRSYSKI